VSGAERTIGRRRARGDLPNALRREAHTLRRRSVAEPSPSHGLAFVAVAIGGLLAGHALSYAFAVPDPYHRDLVLRQSGHGYLPGLTEVAVVLAVGAIAGLLGSAARGRPVAAPRFAGVVGGMVATQVAAFVALEVLERIVAHAALTDLAHHHLLAIGVATQIAVAIAGAGILAWLTRAAGRVASLLAEPVALTRPGPVLALAAVASVPLGSVTMAADPIRGPPPR
jgi:hypothetical protein